MEYLLGKEIAKTIKEEVSEKINRLGQDVADEVFEMLTK